MSARQQDLRKAIEYPESDGQPLGETDKHRKLISHLIEMLEIYFAAQPDVYVSGNLMCYYEENNPKVSISPDVFVVKGAAKHERRVYKFWEEPVPQVVLEITSRKTRKDDFGEKKDLYAWLGVQEYFVFNPDAKLRAPLRAFRLHQGAFVEAIVTNQRVLSEELGLELVVVNKTLRLFDPHTQEFLRTPAEEAIARQEAEERVARLAAKLRELGLDPDQL